MRLSGSATQSQSPIDVTSLKLLRNEDLVMRCQALVAQLGKERSYATRRTSD